MDIGVPLLAQCSPNWNYVGSMLGFLNGASKLPIIMGYFNQSSRKIEKAYYNYGLLAL